MKIEDAKIQIALALQAHQDIVRGMAGHKLTTAEQIASLKSILEGMKVDMATLLDRVYADHEREMQEQRNGNE